MWTFGADESFHPVGMGAGEGPGDDPTPVMADEHDTFVGQPVGQLGDIPADGSHAVLYDLGELRRRVVAAQVGGDGGVVPAEFGQLVAPLVPALGEAVEEQHQRSRPAPGDMKVTGVKGDELVGDQRRDGSTAPIQRQEL